MQHRGEARSCLDQRLVLMTLLLIHNTANTYVYSAYLDGGHSAAGVVHGDGHDDLPAAAVVAAPPAASSWRPCSSTHDNLAALAVGWACRALAPDARSSHAAEATDVQVQSAISRILHMYGSLNPSTGGIQRLSAVPSNTGLVQQVSVQQGKISKLVISG